MIIKIHSFVRWLVIVISSIAFIDALISFYQTISFKEAFEKDLVFLIILFICFIAAFTSLLSGFGAYKLNRISKSRTNAVAMLLSAAIFGLIFMLFGVFQFSGWLKIVWVSKFETIGLCSFFSVILLVLDRRMMK